MSNEQIKNNLSKLRKLMADANIDIYIIPSSDPHLSEYVAARYKSRQFISGFTGSAGTFVITAKEAILYADGRYFIQAEEELKGSSILLFKMKEPGVLPLNQWLRKTLKTKMTLGFDARLFTYTSILSIKKDLSHLDINYCLDKDLIDSVWTNRPALPNSKAYRHEHQYTGALISDKLALIRNRMLELNATTYMLSSLNDIAWLFNLRGSDVLFTPVNYCYGLISDSSAALYIDQSKLSSDLLQHLTDEGVHVHNYNDYYTDIKKLQNQHVLFDPNKVNGLMVSCLDISNKTVQGNDITFMEKACFSDCELNNLKNAHVKDGVAMVNFLYWLDNNVNNNITEVDAKNKVTHFREAMDNFIEPSFEPIPAYGENAAMMHYSASEHSHSVIDNKGLFLIDSGGQYMDGTTDITRTVAVGPLTEEEVHDFTLVLKGHIALSALIFLAGTTGSNIDSIARQPIWEAYMDYKSGTGHSIGYLLGVHEGPSRIRMDHSDITLKPGMVLTNEPGIYKKGQHGIRTENVVVVRKSLSNDMGTFLHFETISFCPIDKRCIDTNLLTIKERQWLNDYHIEVYKQLSPHLKEKQLHWLKIATSTL